MNHFQETITELQGKLREMVLNAEALRRTITLLQKYVPSRHKEKTTLTPTSPAPPATPKKSPPEHKQKPKKKSSSKYLGVSRKGNRWSAFGYLNKTTKYLGLFKIEEEAAAAVQKYLGNFETAQRFRDIAEKKSSPGKSPSGEPAEPEPEPDRRSSDGGWECNKCGRLHKEKIIPLKCENCNHESFKPMRASGKGTYDHNER